MHALKVLARCVWMAVAIGVAWPNALLRGQGGTGLITGRVVDAPSGEPRVNATVQLSSDGGRSRLATTWSDTDGRFVFHDVPASRLMSVRAVRTGYLGGYAGQRTPALGDPGAEPFGFADGEVRRDLTLPLWREAVVTGTVQDAAGDPLVGVMVRALRQTLVAGYPRLQGTWAAKTDDRGVYRLNQLVPGDYLVVVPAASGGAGMPDTALFYPNRPSPQGASALTLSAGDVRVNVDLSPAPGLPGVRLSGMALGVKRRGAQGSGAIGASPLAVRLVSAAWPDPPAGFEVMTTFAGPDGRFTFAHVPSGQYTVRVLDFSARAPVILGPGFVGLVMPPQPGRWLPPVPAGLTLWADVAVSVGTKDLEGLVVPLHAGASISGEVVFDGTAPQPSGTQLLEQPVNVLHANGGEFVAPMQGRAFGSGPAARIETNGRFATAGLPPGKYLLALLPSRLPTWRLRSVSVDGREPVGQVIDVGARAIDGVRLTMTDRPWAQLTGHVRDQGGHARPDAFIYVFPTDQRLWTNFGPLPFLVRLVNRYASPQGAYHIDGLPAGEYFIVATVAALPESWMRAEVLESLVAAAVTIRIADGEPVVLDLTVQVR
jgi:hypothetical protein